MTNEVAKTQSTLPAAETNFDWGQTEVSSNDIVIPKVVMMQPLSNPVTEGKAKFGDFISGATGLPIGNIDVGFEFIPFYMSKFHWVSKLKDGKGKEKEFQFDRVEECTRQADENKPWDDCDQDGVPIKRTFVRRFYGLIKGLAIPVILEAKGTSASFGKKLATQMYVMNAASKLPPCATVIMVNGEKRKNAKGSFAVMDFTPVRPATKEEITDCFHWFKLVKSGDTKTEEEVQKEMNF